MSETAPQYLTMKKCKIVCVLFALMALVLSARAEIAADKKAEIEKMLKLTGMERMMEQMKVQMIASMKANAPDVPSEFWTKFSEKMNTHELIEKLLPVYDKYYSLEDLRAVNAFYSSPSGQKILATLPQVMQEAMRIGQDWGRKIGQEAVAEIEAERSAKANQGK